MALLPGSAAIGAGTTTDYPGTTTPITTDQRGQPLEKIRVGCRAGSWAILAKTNVMYPKIKL